MQRSKYNTAEVKKIRWKLGFRLKRLSLIKFTACQKLEFIFISIPNPDIAYGPKMSEIHKIKKVWPNSKIFL